MKPIHAPATELVRRIRAREVSSLELVDAHLARIEAVDTDEDGKVYAGEIVAFLAQQQAALRAQVHAKAGDRDDPLFAALDINGDDRLDGREIEAAGDRLQELDRSGDGLIGIDEIPTAMFVGLARGSLENQDALFVPPSIATRGPAADAPRRHDWPLSSTPISIARSPPASRTQRPDPNAFSST